MCYKKTTFVGPLNNIKKKIYNYYLNALKFKL